MKAVLAVSVFLVAAFGQAGETGKPNHLIHEKSPYLLQHAYNPVDWYPWGDEAFAKARRENKPIFLSIGYATCHWCHVMERESYSDPKIAAIMNKYFVSVKVDREERPDVDNLYMTLAQAAGWGGGWPLNLWLTPSLKPFYGGTYFPPESRWGRPGLAETAEHIGQLWKTRGAEIVASGDDLVEKVSGYMAVQGRSGPLDAAALDNGFRSLEKNFDPSRGGFGGAPKFPMPIQYNFLLRYYARTGNKKALDMTARTLRQMAAGGLYDQVGGGFHRYSTDDHWHIPHFEKMLYDNAQLAVNYLEAYQLTKDPDFARVARETLDYVLRDMTHPDGGFFSAEDADSLRPGAEEKGEGAFYVWEKPEILKLAGAEAGEIFSYRYGVKEHGNAESDPQGEFREKNILYVAHSIPETAKRFHRTPAEIESVLRETKSTLFEARARRPRPQRDDKVLAAWNGLMISALAKGSQVLDEARYRQAAEKAARFVRERLYDAQSRRLYRRWRDGERKVPGNADDYAFLAQGLIDLYEASFDPQWLQWALELTETQDQLFYDAKDGGFYSTTQGQDKNLLVRSKQDSDNVEPSANSVAALNLLRLAQFTDRKELRAMAEKTLTLFGKQMKEQPQSLLQMLVALDFDLAKPRQIVIAGDPQAADTRRMLRLVQSRFIPVKILMLADGGKDQAALTRWLPFMNGVSRLKGKATAYVCVDYACNLPTSDPGTLDKILESKPPVTKSR